MPVGTHGVVRGLSPPTCAGPAPRSSSATPTISISAPARTSCATWAGCTASPPGTGRCSPTRGGFQVFSLEGLRTHRGGRRRVPEPRRRHLRARSRPSARRRSSGTLGADVAMAFDHVVPGQAPHELAEEGMERTLRWLERCREARATGGQAAGDGDGGARDSTRHRLRRPPNPLAHHPGRHPRRPPAPLARGHPRARAVDRHRHRRALGGRAQAGDAPGPGDARAGPAERRSPVILWESDFPPICSRGSRAGWTCSTASRPRGTAGTGPRGCRPGGSTCGAPRSRDRTEPLDPECDCETCTTYLARLSPAPVRGRGHARAAAGLDPQHPVPGPAGRAGPGPHPATARSIAGSREWLEPHTPERRHGRTLTTVIQGVSCSRPRPAAASPSSSSRWRPSAWSSTS